MEQTFVFLDLETTGLNPETDDIIEIGAVKATAGEIIDSFTTLVTTSRKLPTSIISLTGINDEMLKEAPALDQVSSDLLSFIGNLPIVGHNVTFDLNFITAKTGFRLTNPVLDTMDFVQIALPQASSYRLDTVRAILGFAEGQNHRALADAQTACRIFFGCLEAIERLEHETLMQVYKMVKDHAGPFSHILIKRIEQTLKKFPEGKTDSSYGFLAAQHSEEPSLFSEKGKSHKQPVIDLTKLDSYLEASGPLATRFPQYRYRAGQVEMLATVAKGFREKKHMIIEAGTGTGKSLAYLIPAAAWAVAENTKVVITTHTINLQEQLWTKDLPTIREVTGLEFTAALVKGRTNYLCLRRWESKLKEPALLEHGELVFYLKTLVWLTKTVTGDKSELNIMPLQYLYWNEISADQDTCLGSTCPWCHRQCFVSKARRQAEAADLLIVNHSLLLADIRLQNVLLPAYDYLIIDEAHHLESSATEQLGWTVSINNLRHMLFTMVRSFSSGLSPGLLHQLKHNLRHNTEFHSQVESEKLDGSINEAFDKVRLIQESVGEIEQFLKSWAWSERGDSDEESFYSFRIKNLHRTSDAWMSFVSAKENYGGRNLSLIQSLRKILRILEPVKPEQLKALASLIKEIEFQVKFLEETNANMHMLMEGGDEHVFWVEIENRAKREIRLKCAPVSVSSLLFENLFNTKRSTLLTSATISVDGQFDHFMGRTGLSFFSAEEVLSKILPSPFCYEKQAILCVPRDLPEAGTVPDDEYMEAITPVIGDIATIFGGKTLVLFTSHKMLREVHSKLQPRLEPKGITVIGHKIDGGRTRLMNDFRDNGKAVLLGASSFWEGIDLAGDVLKCVILVRLPFSPPNTPVVEARIEEITKNNKDAFYGYSVPDAVIRFKQGFGRLIRSEADEGVIVVLDRRIEDKRYGRKFLNSLPIKTHFKGDTSTVLQKISDWQQGERPQEGSLNILGNTGDIEKFLGRVSKKRSTRKDKR